MSPESRHTCILLGLEPHGENLQFIRALSCDIGLTGFLRRRSRRSPAPDLFMTVRVRLRNGSTGPAFLEELEPLKTRSGIGKSYQRLEHASRFATLLMRNSEHLENPPHVFQIVERVFDAFEATPVPGPCLLKGIFELARIEGLPAREDWLENLRATDFENAQRVLYRPLNEIDSTNAAAADSLCNSILRWLSETADWHTGDSAPSR